ncbi:MAG TPA: cytochrome c peroxidase [Albitalea sp.]|uniref:cytochrome-c peroxidase n=1 Tax=Piscinibacter sp. TaxID=1903157 RepID=UPI002ED2D7AF
MRRLLVVDSLCTVALMAAMLLPGAVSARGDEPLSPLPQSIKLDTGKVALGARLFVDTRFAKDNSVSCASCHNLSKGGVDPRPEGRVFSTGAGGARHIFNTPTVYNAGFNFRQQWGGGAESLEDLVDRVVNGKRVFDSSWPEVLGKLSADKDLADEFRKVYPGKGLAKETVQDALAVFQRSLITPSRFDRYLSGDTSAISGDERRGYERFKAYGCVGCHQGVNVGGNMLQRFGAMNDYFADRAKAGMPLTDGDRGRFNATKKEGDMHVFKVPSLRNVALTAPYFHNGSAATLEEAVDVMFRYQLGRSAPAEDKALIVKFLKSLTGEQFKE